MALFYRKVRNSKRLRCQENRDWRKSAVFSGRVFFAMMKIWRKNGLY
ncbi:hypothetical protein ACU6T4_00870 [Avibacterium paragallinarum]|nr:hypothetical protein [Avibacterium paragallinarum]QIR12186.1 hypothetical protein HBL79_08120 [Avibacterium paragallinarum]QJE08992.1 hypothetical protein HHJ62_00920 [Avibacterium paragallinarum]QJE11189.1 hypothetical protein HHJ61_00920 [Avibacterium paragallinarum]QJE13386.1 hypothetical protein HHJ60_00925 [Avibacterium paragallinarum]QJE15587.1 hypothetical protein HHJ59_00915 [Avibacterium paragallinarum]